MSMHSDMGRRCLRKEIENHGLSGFPPRFSKLLSFLQVVKATLERAFRCSLGWLLTPERSGPLPFRRVYKFEVLEPRRLLAAMTEVPIVGGVTDEMARIMVRTDEAASVVVEYSTDPVLTVPLVTPASLTNSGSDFTTTFTLENLQPLEEYYYRILVDGVAQQTETFPHFQTFPEPSTSIEFSFGIAADSAEVSLHPNLAAPAFASLAADAPSFMLQIGDFDHRDPRTLEEYRQMHRDVRDPNTLAGADFAEHIAAQMPVFHVWDDHDYGRQDGDKTLPSRAEALQAFKEYYPTPELANPENGIWHSFQYGQAEFFMLDTRSQRDRQRAPDNANKSMLDGDNITDGQLDWLKNGLLSSTADWKFVISTVTFNLEARQGSADLWRGYSTEAYDIGSFIETNEIRNVVVFSADLHTGGGIDDGTNSLIGLPEITVGHTNLTGGNNNKMGAWSEGVTGGGQGGGYALITVTANNDIILEAKAADGSVRHSFTLQNVSPSPEADIAVTPFSVDFGSVNVGETVQDVVTITNTGIQILTVSNLATTNSAFLVVSPATPLDVAPGDSAEVTIEFAPTFAGQELGELEITSNDPDEALVSVELSGNGVVPGGNEFHINAGGGDYSSTTGVDYVADKAFVAGDFGYVGGDTRSTGAGINGTEDDVLYQSLRFNRGDPFSYVFDALPTGDFEVTLYFSEPAPSADPGERIFDVLAEGVVRLDDFDVVAAAGAPRTAHNETFVVTVGDGQLNLDFVPVDSNHAFVNGISVVELLPLAASSSSDEPFFSSELVDAAVALALAEVKEANVEPDLIETQERQKFILAEPARQSRPSSSSDDSISAATDKRDNEFRFRQRQRRWEDAADEVFADVVGRWTLR